jgi:serine/threonine-protein kinase
VARVIDVGTIPGGIPCIVLEYLDGYDLAYTLKKDGVLPVELAVDYVMQALEAVAEAHSLNIVHRDLRPSNLFVVRRPDGSADIKVIDFGLSKSLSGDETALTKRQQLVGSPEYMSPEQARGASDIDTRTDLWSMGVVLYELLCGDRPFEGTDYHDVLGKVAYEDPAPMALSCPDIPPALELVIRRCLERNRENRFQTVAELALALLPFGSKAARFSYENILGIRDADPDTGAASIPREPPVRNRRPAPRRVISVAMGPVPSLTEMARRRMDELWVEQPERMERHVTQRRAGPVRKGRWIEVLPWVLCVVAVIAAGLLAVDRVHGAARPDPLGAKPISEIRAGAALGAAP